MQKLDRLILTKFSVFFLLVTHSAYSQTTTFSLSQADSLFSAKQYKEALTIYEQLIEEEQSYSPAMLLKVAFISEGMGDFAKATLYLSKYYDYSPNPRVIAKIKTLTNQATLIGYEVSDQEKLVKFLLDWKMELTSFFTFVAVLMLILAVALKDKQKAFYVPAALTLGLAFAANNFLSAPESAIITGNGTLIMDSPTSAGNLIRRVEPGHRVKIKAKVDMWYEVEWNNRTAYIRQHNLSKI